MKKLLIIFLVCFILVAGGAGAYFAYRANIKERSAKDVLSDLNSQMNTTHMFAFEAPKVKNKTEIVKPDVNSTLVPMYLGNGYYYEVSIPADSSIVTDYATYIYSTDMTFKVSIVKGINPQALGASLGMSDYRDYSQSIVTTKVGLKKPQEAGTALIDDIGIVATCYDSPLTFATILNGLEHGAVRQYQIMDIAGDNTTAYCMEPIEIPYDEGSAIGSLLTEKQAAGANMYRYDDGWLTEYNATRGHADVKSDMLTRVFLASNGSHHLDRVMEATNASSVHYWYAEIGNFTILCISDTINHTYACLGSGKTARNDIVLYLRSVYTR